MIKITKKWVDVAKTALEPEDEVRYTYRASHNGQRGYLVLSNRTLLFISEKGFLGKTYDLVWEMPYDQVDEVRQFGDLLWLNEGEKRHIFVSDDAARIEESIQNLRMVILA